MKRKLSLVLCVLMSIVMLSSCGSKEITKDNADEQVTLKWVFGGPGKLEDSDRVWEEFNKRLPEYLPNTKVEFEVIPHAEYSEKWRLMSAAKEAVDVVWVSYAQNFVDEVGKGAYMDMTELVEEYGSEMKEGFPDWLLDLTTIDGKIYAVPNYQMMAIPYGFGIDEEHIQKGWFDMEKAESIFNSGETPHISNYKIFEDYLAKVHASGEDVKYVSKAFLSEGVKWKIGFPHMGIEPIICNAVITRKGDDYKIYDILTDFPENYEYYDMLHEWYKKGYIRSDILENPEEKNSNVLLVGSSCYLGSNERLSMQTGRNLKIFKSNDFSYVPYKGSSTNTAIAANSKHPARAMQLINLMNCKRGTDLINLLCYGFEGEHYEKTEEDNGNRINWLGAGIPGSSSNKYGYENWAVGNSMVTFTTQNDPIGWNEYCEEEINQKATVSRLAGFSLDTTPIQLEIAQYNAKMQEYTYLNMGTTENYKELLAERNARLKEAGSEKIVKEVQRQVDEWLKTKKTEKE